MTFIPIQTVAQLRERVRDAQQHNTPVYPYAGNTQQHQLAPARQTGLSLHLSGLNQLIDYPHQDLTITVQAGMTVDTLQKLLAEHQQTLPIDVPNPAQATVGGSIAANINGPRRTGWGTWRDYLIGLSWINDQGEEAKAGGRVVKNVAGYDFCKLFIGSFGTLGIITQVTLKVKPMQWKRSLIGGEVKKEQVSELIDLIRHSRLKPTLFVIEPDQKPTWIVKLGFEESGQAVNWQHDHLREITQGLVTLNAVNEGIEGPMDVHDLVEFANAGESVTFEANVPGSRCAEFSMQAQPLVQMMQIQPATGVIIGHLSRNISIEEASKTIEKLRSVATTTGGHLILPRCPAQWRPSLHPFGPPRSDWHLMRKVKYAMDPNNIFQRGRHEILKTDN